MLRACQQVLRDGGRMAFFVIAVAAGLSPRDHELALEAGPTLVATDAPYPELIKAAGFDDLDEIDVTDEFHTANSAWLAEFDRCEDELRALIGSDAFDEKQDDRRAMRQAIEAGLLERKLFLARK